MKKSLNKIFQILTLVVLVLSINFKPAAAVLQASVISSFTPSSQLVGSNITILGTFGASVSGVYFGSVKQNNFSTKTNSMLVCKVPAGASLDFISLLDENGYAYSSTKFTPRFAGNNTLTATNFSTAANSYLLGNFYYSFQTKVFDLDNDGKNDIVNMCINYTTNFIDLVILKNAPQGIGNNIGTDFILSLTLPTSASNGGGLSIADVNNDGLFDLVIASNNSSSQSMITVFPNNSSNNTISFDTPETFIIASKVDNASGLKVADFNQDGKVDFAVSDGVTPRIVVFVNDIVGNSISTMTLSNSTEISLNYNANVMSYGDLDLDGKLDILAGSGSTTDLVTLINNSSSGSIAFNKITILSSGWTAPILDIDLVDIDLNGKLDLIFSNLTSINFIENTTSAIGAFTVDNFNVVTLPVDPTGFVLSDLDGDGKSDLIVSQNFNVNGVTTMKIARNVAQTGVFNGSMFSYSDLPILNSFEQGLKSLVANDFNGDGKPELIGIAQNGFTQYMYPNEIGEATPKITGLSSFSGAPGDVISIFGQNLNFAYTFSITDTTQGSNPIYFNFVPLSDNLVVAPIPQSVFSAFYGKISVERGYLKDTFGSIFSVTAPDPSIITALSSTLFAKGYVLSIFGQNFSDVSQYLEIRDNADVSSIPPYSIYATIENDNLITVDFSYCNPNLPENTPFLLKLHKNSFGSTLTPQEITVLPSPTPTITNVSPSNFSPKDTIVIAGTDLDKIDYILFPHNIYYIYPNTFIKRTTDSLVLVAPNFYYSSNIDINGTLTFGTCITQIQSPQITVQIPPLPTITGFSPSESYAGALVTLFGDNLQNSTYINLVDGLDQLNATIISASKNQAVIQWEASYPRAGIMKSSIRSFWVDDIGTAEGFTTSAGTFTINPYPTATITGFSPVSVFPFEEVSITGFNLDFINEVFFPNDSMKTGGAYSVEVISPNLLIAKPNFFQINQSSFGKFNVSYSFTNKNAKPLVLSPSLIEIKPFDGIITNLQPMKSTFNSNERLLAKATFTGTFLPAEYADYILSVRNDSIYFDGEASSIDVPIFAVNSSVPGVLDLIQKKTSMNYEYSFPTNENYYLENVIKYYPQTKPNTPQSQLYLNISPISDNFKINAVPEFNPEFPFFPAFAPKDSVIQLYGYNFEGVSITGVYFNLTIPSNFEVIYNGLRGNVNIFATVPGGNTLGRIRITYVGGEVISPFNFNEFIEPICDNIFTNIDLQTKRFALNDSSAISFGFIQSVEVDLQMDVQLSNIISLFTNPLTIGSDTSTRNVSSYVIPFFIPDNIPESNDYAIRLKFTKKEDGETCVTFPIFNVTIGGVKYVPVQSISIFANSDSSKVFYKALDFMEVKTVVNPSNATNKYVKLQLLQTSDLIYESDTISHYFRYKSNANENGNATIIGVSVNNPNAISSFEIALVGKDAIINDNIIRNKVIDSTGAPVYDNTCDRSVELAVDSTLKNFIAFQWFFINNNNDTLRIVGENKSVFRPVIQGNYFVTAYDSTFNYTYNSYPLEDLSPSKPIIERPGIDDIEADTLLISSEADQYQWFVNGKLIKGETNQSLTIYYNGTYYVKITDESTNCKAVSDTIVFGRPDFVDIGRSDIYGSGNTIENYGKLVKRSLKLYPNPASTQFSLQYQSNSTRTINVKVFNSLGLEVFSQNINYYKNPIRLITIPSSDYHDGIYNVQVTDGNDIVNHKLFVKQ